jgi:hypothetical protein
MLEEETQISLAEFANKFMREDGEPEYVDALGGLGTPDD